MPAGLPKIATAHSPVGEDEEAEFTGSGADEEWLD